MRKRLTVDMTDEKHTQFKIKTTADHLSMVEVLNWAIDDYIAGKWKPRPYDRQKKVSKPIT